MPTTKEMKLLVNLNIAVMGATVLLSAYSSYTAGDVIIQL
jgi:hypothetical protein